MVFSCSLDGFCTADAAADGLGVGAERSGMLVDVLAHGPRRAPEAEDRRGQPFPVEGVTEYPACMPGRVVGDLVDLPHRLRGDVEVCEDADPVGPGPGPESG